MRYGVFIPALIVVYFITMMSETVLPNLFKKYMQAGADTTPKYGGTGLGLAICKQLLEPQLGFLK
ncbi:putative histidine kinase [Helianthus annuus]|uniref:histidine kinase n=1 Tax=Helianthus annuus TaxID=4232 RepID=A0A9K3EER5_HELAN|nr:putative histidine kinase [Helianthus annuus]